MLRDFLKIRKKLKQNSDIASRFLNIFINTNREREKEREGAFNAC